MSKHDHHRFEDDGGPPPPLNYCPYCDVSEDEDHKEGCPLAVPWERGVGVSNAANRNRPRLPLTDGPHDGPRD